MPDNNALALDDVSVLPVSQPVLQSAQTSADGVLTFTWSSVASVKYQAQYIADLNADAWLDFGNPIISTGSSTRITDTVASGANRFYRLVLLP